MSNLTPALEREVWDGILVTFKGTLKENGNAKTLECGIRQIILWSSMDVQSGLRTLLVV